MFNLFLRSFTICVTSVHDHRTHQDQLHAAEHQSHSLSTASGYYKQLRLADQAAEDGMLCHSAIVGDLQRKKEQRQEQKREITPRNSDSEYEIPQDQSSDSDYDPELILKKKRKILSKKFEPKPSTSSMVRFEEFGTEKALKGIGFKGQSTFSAEERAIIETSFYNIIYGQKVPEGEKPSVPRRNVVRKIIQECQLEEKLGEKCVITKVIGCIQGIINRNFGYRKTF